MTLSRSPPLLEHPSAGLLRKDQAAFILSFLHEAFKQGGVSQIAEEDLRARLENWLAERRAAESFEWERTARDYLEEWCSPKMRLAAALPTGRRTGARVRDHGVIREGAGAGRHAARLRLRGHGVAYGKHLHLDGAVVAGDLARCAGAFDAAPGQIADLEAEVLRI